MTRPTSTPRPPAGATLPAPDRLSSVTAGGRPFSRRGPAPRVRSAAVAAGLRHSRRAAGLSLAKAALASGYSLRTIHKWEVGEHGPTPFAVSVLAEVYGVTEAAISGYYPPREYRATRVGPWETGRACESGWAWEEVAE